MSAGDRAAGGPALASLVAMLLGAFPAVSGGATLRAPSPAAGQAPPALESVDVTGKREALRKPVTSFVSRITIADGSNTARWREPICPWVIGMAPGQGEFITSRIREAAVLAGARVDDTGKCSANLLVFLTTQPDDLVGSLPGPTHRLKDSRILSTVSEELAAVVIVVDTANTGTVTFGQLSDYISMVALAQVDLRAGVDEAPTILQLFAGREREQASHQLTDWERAFLKAVYGLQDSHLHEPSIVAIRMLEYLASPQ
jgi:hypothetical protein